MTARTDIAGIPGGDLVRRGLEDLDAGRETAEAALVEIARSRFIALGFAVPLAPASKTAELRLYTRLAERDRDRDPYLVYSAWLEQLDSFLWAATRASAAHAGAGQAVAPTGGR